MSDTEEEKLARDAAEPSASSPAIEEGLASGGENQAQAEKPAEKCAAGAGEPGAAAVQAREGDREKREARKKGTAKNQKGPLRTVLIVISVLFVVLMLVLPLISVIVNSLSEGVEFYIESLQTEYVISAVRLTLFAAVITVIVNTVFGLVASWAITRFSFKGKQVIATLIDIPFSISPVIAGLAFVMMFGRMGWAAPIVDGVNDFFGTDIQIVYAVPGVVLATIFVTFPFVSRELIPVLNSRGTDEETAAAQMGASGWTIFRRVTFPQIKWALLYGMVLCGARALGEFGAVSTLSKTRGETFTLPLEIDALYMSGSSESITAAFAAASVLVLFAIVLLIIRNILEVRSKKHERDL